MGVVATRFGDFGEYRKLLASVGIYERLFGARPGSVMQLGCGACRGIDALRAEGLDAAGAESLPEFLEGPLDEYPYVVRALRHRVPLASASYDLVVSFGCLARFECYEMASVVGEHLRLARRLVVMELPGTEAGVGVGSAASPGPSCVRPVDWWRSLVRWLGAEAIGEEQGWLIAVPAPRQEMAGRWTSDHVPTVSIVIPCYNLGAYLPETLESVRRQTRGDWEAIVVNDGSTDDTADRVKEAFRRYGDPRFRYLEQPNRGLPAARNAGIERARGRYILPLDADDLLEPTFLEQTVEVLEAFPEFGIVYTHLRAFGSEQWEAACPPWHPCRLLVQNRLPYASLYRREVWESTGGYDPAMREGYEDWDFWVTAAERGWRATCVPRPLFLYRRRPGSMLSRAYRSHDRLVARIHAKHQALVATCT